jgi:proteasome lid subunit RPN8/RPN11
VAGNATYRLPQAAWQLSFTPEALKVLRKHAQVGRFSRESVGQLYSKDLAAKTVVVSMATCLTPTLARWARVRFDVAQAMRERERLFDQGWHCLGFWHTHPEPAPSPSSEDRAMARDHARAALSVTNGMIFAIVGTLPLPAGLRVWCDNGLELTALSQVTDQLKFATLADRK